MEVFVIRHTPVDLAKGICYGQLDVAVDNSVFDSYQSHYEAVLPTSIIYTFSSPLKRCLILAESLQRGTITTDTRLMEMNFGTWEGMEWNAIPRKETETWSKDFVHICPPEGENLSILFDRVADFMSELRTCQAKQVLLVVHGGVIRCILSYLLQIPLHNAFKVPVGFGETLKFHLGTTSNEDYITQLN